LALVRSHLRPAFILAPLALATCYGCAGQRDAAASSNDERAADTERHLKVLAEVPRPMGSVGHARAQAYLVDQARALGLDVRVHDRAAARAPFPEGGPLLVARTADVVAVLPGRQHEHALLLVAHYDTVPRSPGAADDGLPVSAMLATMRALRAEPPPQNDVVFLFSDGEEAGRLGAQSFLDSAPEARRVAAVINFEARGTRGPLLLFETGPRNGWVSERFAAAGAPVRATSAAEAIYALLPNDTDFSVFRQAGLPGLNVAAVGGYVNYHAVTDDLQHLDRELVDQYARTVLNLTRSIADADLTSTRAPSAVYFTVLGNVLVRYPEWCARLLGLAGLAAVIVLLVRRAVERRMRVLLAVTTAIAILLGVALISAAGWQVWRLVRPLADERSLPQNGGHALGLYLPGFVSFGLAVMTGLLVVSRRLAAELAMGSALVTGLLGAVASFLAPGASYLFVFPAVVLVAVEWRGADAPGSSPRRALERAIAACMILLILLPFVSTAALTLGAPGLPVVAGMAAWMTALLVPPLRITEWGHRWTLLRLVSGAALALLVVGRLTHSFDSNRPRPDSVQHLTDADTRTTVRASTDPQLDEYTRRTLGPAADRRSAARYLPELSRPIWMTDQPYVGEGPPQAAIAQVTAGPSDRTVVIEVRPAVTADVLDLRFAPEVTPESVTMDGETVPLPARKNRSWLQIWPAQMRSPSLRVTVHAPPAGPVGLSAVARSFRTDASSAPAPASRPDGFMPTPFGFDAGDLTAVHASFAL
jgi:hypothetical protein